MINENKTINISRSTNEWFLLEKHKYDSKNKCLSNNSDFLDKLLLNFSK